MQRKNLLENKCKIRLYIKNKKQPIRIIKCLITIVYAFKLEFVLYSIHREDRFCC